MDKNALFDAAFAKIIGEKKLSVLKMLINRCDEGGFVNVKISDICETLNISKPTAIAAIDLFTTHKILTRLKNGLLKFNLC